MSDELVTEVMEYYDYLESNSIGVCPCCESPIDLYEEDVPYDYNIFFLCPECGIPLQLQSIFPLELVEADYTSFYENY